MILWFKKYKHTNNGTNWDFDLNCLAIDDNFSNLQIGIPERKINEYNIYGQGAVLIPSYFFSNRSISFTYRFKKRNNHIFSIDKDFILLNWFFSIDDIYLVRNTERGLQYIKGYFRLNAKEKYKSYAISDEITIDFITEDPFFNSNILKSLINNSHNNETIFNITNNGIFTSFYIEYESGGNCNKISIIYIHSLFTRQLDISEILLNTGDIFIIDMRDFSFSKNGDKFIPVFDGNSFYIENGESILKFKNTTTGKVKLFFRERFI